MVKKIINKVKAFKKRLAQDYLPGFFCRSRRLSNLYYCLISPAFSREHQAVLAGKSKHFREAKKQKANYFLLVRNTHRIEKGLLMRPRKAQFATSYIHETLDSFSNIWKNCDSEKDAGSQNKWFKDVLSEYFNVVSDTPLIAEQRKKFKMLVNGNDTISSQGRSIPYCRVPGEYSRVDFEEFYKLTRQRRSVRWFLPKPVPRELIDKAVLAASQSPSACNRQPFEFRIFDDHQLVRKLADIPMGTKGYGHSLPVFAVVVGNLDAYASERDRHVIYIDGALASMTFMLALETLGLSSCPINWPDIEEKEELMQKTLNLGPWQRPIMCLGLGYPDPDGMVAFSEKRSLDQIRNYN
ncbi:nitroreductase [Anseongella ginsenosidimutans]|uniref:Nitroreductase n=1 Tax=Anseongella ginsenosidimutans TaxID=496056 RepID=A0A4R3KTX6_9SPHI|nr:nitroreductase family protein [Anseongella ginsenosidimutans]QEC53360.1 nitroreductase family protein [Anseongella ginsenosidimutans]TCS88243.1 nitroreductase [Anseongella ginsenosidimutans]